MTKETLLKMFAGLSNDEKKATVTELGITDTALIGELMAAGATPAVSVQPPAIAPPAAATAPPPITNFQAPDAPPANSELMAQLAAERSRRITSECTAFVFQMKQAGKVAPAEEADINKMYATLAALNDNDTALNQYKASLNARPANPMIKEQIVSTQMHVLPFGQQQDTRTEAEKEKALVNELLNTTEDGKAAALALAQGKIIPAFKQFAVNAE